MRFPAWALLAAMHFAPDAHAVWAHRPTCEREQDAVNDRKDELDKCINRFEASHKPPGEPGEDGKKVTEKETACTKELQALISATDNLKGCMEKRIWWKPPADK